MLHQLLKLKSGLLVAGLSVLVSALLYLANPVALQILRNAAFDQYQRWSPRVYQPAPVHIIDIDEESLRRLGQWPWPRTRIAELISHLQQAKAAAIVFDVLFAEPDRTSPHSMLSIWQPPGDVARYVAQLPDHDQVLAQAIGHGGVVLGFALDQTHSLQAQQTTQAHYVVLGEPPQPYVHEFAHALTSLPMLQDVASGNGAITFIPDADGVVRKVPLLLRQSDQLLPSLSAEALRVAQHASNYTVRSEAEQGAGLAEIRIGKLVIPTTPQGEVWVHYTKPVAARYIPAWKILAGEVSADLLKDNILLVGSSAHGIMDLRFSPISGVIPGVEVHAQMLEQVLTGSALNRPAWARAVEILVIVLGGLLVGLIALTMSGLLSLGAVLLILAMVAASAWYAFSVDGVLLDPIAPGLALLLTFILSSITRHIASERHQRWVRQAFSRYISPNLVNYLIDHPDALVLSTRRTQCSFIFTDLAGFTSLMERLDPGQASSLLNVYLDRMIAIAFAHHGTLDRIVGDSVAIMFSAPLPQPDHQRRALLCALEMQQFATQYVAELNAKGVAFCETRIGIHSGEVVVGNFGGAALFDYRALGDPVNTASRLENANKHLGTLICVSEATLSGCNDMPARPVGRLLFKGKQQPIMIYEPLQAECLQRKSTQQKPVGYQQYCEAYELMRNHQPQALAAFESLLAANLQDPLVRLHVDRLRQGEIGDLIALGEK